MALLTTAFATAATLISVYALVIASLSALGALSTLFQQLTPHPITDVDNEELRKAIADRANLDVHWVDVNGEGQFRFQVSGLLPKLEIGLERPFERDLSIGDPDFDDTIYWQVWGKDSPDLERNADFLSRLDAKTRTQLRSLVKKTGVRINLGHLELPASLPRTDLPALDVKSQFFQQVADVASTLAVQREEDGTTIVSRLTNLVLTDPSMGFRRTCLRTLLSLLAQNTTARRTLLEQLITEDDACETTETIAIEALADVSHVRALAAAYWLQQYGTKAAMQPIAYAMNAPNAPTELTTTASKALASFEVRYGKLSTGVLSMVEPNQGGTLSIHERTGQLSEADLKRKATIAERRQPIND